jgi:hypothetical protein
MFRVHSTSLVWAMILNTIIIIIIIIIIIPLPVPLKISPDSSESCWLKKH